MTQTLLVPIIGYKNLVSRIKREPCDSDHGEAPRIVAVQADRDFVLWPEGIACMRVD